MITKGVSATEFFKQGLHHRFLLQMLSFGAVKRVNVNVNENLSQVLTNI